MTAVLIPFARTDASQNPNLRVKDGGDSVEPYMRAMTVAFASFRRWNPDAELQLVSNAPPDERHLQILGRFGVRYTEVPFVHRPPHGFVNRFEASLYLLDALNAASDGTTVYVDPDVLCLNSLAGMLEALGEKAGALRLDTPVDWDINGLSRAQAGELHGLLGESDPAPTHYGGEIYVLPSGLLTAIVSRSNSAWNLALERHRAGLSKFTTEEHILGYALRGVPLGSVNLFARRIWTTHRHRRIGGDESGLVLWHLPAEKDRGFRLLYEPAIDLSSWFWKGSREEFVERCGRAMGLHHRTPRRLVLDAIGFGLVQLERYGVRLAALTSGR